MRLTFSNTARITILAALLTTTVASTAISDEARQLGPLPEVPSEAFAEGAIDEDGPRVETRLLVDHTSVAPGQTFRVGVLFNMDPEWHIYWKNPGASGLPTNVVWSGLATVDETQWPAPAVFSEADGFIITYGYDDEVLLFAEATAPSAEQNADSGFELEASLSYLACREQCIRGTATLTRQVGLGDAAVAPTAEAERFASYAGLLPRQPAEVGVSIDTVFSTSAVQPNDEFQAAIGVVSCLGPPSDGTTCPDFTLPEGGAALGLAPLAIPGADLEVTESGDHPTAFSGNVVRLTGYAGPDEFAGELRLQAVVNLVGEDGQRVPVWIDSPFPHAPLGSTTEANSSALLTADLGGTPREGQSTSIALSPETTGVDSGSEPESSGGMSLWWALISALLGGLILNIMPCVFPVLAFKVNAFLELSTKLEYSRLRSRIPSLIAYQVGVIVPLWILAGVILALRSAGTMVGWGVQFQHPEIISVVGGVVVVFAANLFGAFEISLGAAGVSQAADKRSGLLRSFLEGILLVILATPCSAPYLGPAIGFAILSESILNVLVVFGMVGVGLVLPFAVLVLVPGFTKVLPKPGGWMIRFKQFVGFTFLAAARRRGWIVGQTTGVAGISGYLQFVLACGVAAWVFGIAQHRPVPRIALGAVVALAITVAAGWWFLRFEMDTVSEPPVADGSDEGWLGYDESEISSQLEAGRPVFVDFTADWCATCKTNEHLVIASDEVQGAIRRHNVALYIADWTRPDARIEAALARHGRVSVPMYLVYSPSAPDSPELLPEILTVETVVDAIRAAALPDAESDPS